MTNWQETLLLIELKRCSLILVKLPTAIFLKSTQRCIFTELVQRKGKNLSTSIATSKSLLTKDKTTK